MYEWAESLGRNLAQIEVHVQHGPRTWLTAQGRPEYDKSWIQKA